MLSLSVWMGKDGTFKIYRKLYKHDVRLTDAVMKLDYNYTPWPRKGGNLLW